MHQTLAGNWNQTIFIIRSKLFLWNKTHRCVFIKMNNYTKPKQATTKKTYSFTHHFFFVQFIKKLYISVIRLFAVLKCLLIKINNHCFDMPQCYPTTTTQTFIWTNEWMCWERVMCNELYEVKQKEWNEKRQIQKYIGNYGRKKEWRPMKRWGTTKQWAL